MMGCIWSCSTTRMLAFPVATMIRFCHNHGLIQIANRPQWRTVRGGSRHYVEKIVAGLPDKRLNTPVRGITRSDAGVLVTTDAGVERFDHVVLATHSDQSLALLGDASPAEAAVLDAIRYQSNHAVLHTDASVLPRNPAARASWNYRMDGCDSDDKRVKISYDLKILQRIADDADYVVTLNADGAVDPSRVLAEMTYAHPTFTRASVAAQREIHLLNDGRTAFAGAWQGWGFHEDGCASGVRAAQSLGAGW
jgi:predicted NAD/FAD-binding protein